MIASDFSCVVAIFFLFFAVGERFGQGVDFKEGRFGFVSDKGDDDVIDKYGKIEIALARFPIRLFTDTFLFLFSENSERLILPFSPNTVIKKKNANSTTVL